MNFHLHRQGKSEGPFPLEELQRRREAGELTGAELVWREGMATWRTLDSVLRQPPPEAPAAPARTPRRSTTPALAWIIVLVVVLVVVGIGAFGWAVVMGVRQGIRQSAFRPPSDAGTAEARKPVTWTTNTLTAKDVLNREREFRVRQWLEGYDQRGDHRQACDAAARRLIESWIARNYGGAAATNKPAPEEQAEALAGDAGCTDALVLAVVAVNSGAGSNHAARLERAVAALEGSRHRAYLKFFATVRLAEAMKKTPDRTKALDAAALRLLGEAFKDGSLRPEDQPEMAEIILNRWGSGFWKRNQAAVFPVVAEAGESFAWLALLLEGEHHITEGWKARGSGYANTVSAKGWQGFGEHTAAASECLTKAWKLHPEWPQAPSRMITVAMAEAGAEEMRLWFDRAATAQIDYPEAWSHLRWGLRPRWHGSRAAMLALGVTAVNTARFDTDVPRMFMDSVRELEQEAELAHGRHFYGRSDIWPHFRRMYEGYIAAPSQADSRDGWRSTYAVVAHLAGHDDVARVQLEALAWQPRQWNLEGWSVDLSLLPLEVAARTGPASNHIAEAELALQGGHDPEAARLYQELAATNRADERTRAFIRQRQAAMAVEQQLRDGGWVDFLPTAADDPNWVFLRGDHERLADGTLEVRAGTDGHLLYSRVPVGGAVEVRGEFEVVKSSNRAFQAGLGLGLPALNDSNWIAISMRRSAAGEDSIRLAVGWKSEETSKPVKFKDGPNAFLFRLRNKKVTLSLNGEAVWKDVPRPQPIYAGSDEFRLGLAAGGDRNGTVLRYRHLQVRIAPRPPPAPKK